MLATVHIERLFKTNPELAVAVVILLCAVGVWRMIATARGAQRREVVRRRVVTKKQQANASKLEAPVQQGDGPQDAAERHK